MYGLNLWTIGHLSLDLLEGMHSLLWVLEHVVESIVSRGPSAIFNLFLFSGLEGILEIGVDIEISNACFL